MNNGNGVEELALRASFDNREFERNIGETIESLRTLNKSVDSLSESAPKSMDKFYAYAGNLSEELDAALDRFGHRMQSLPTILDRTVGSIKSIISNKLLGVIGSLTRNVQNTIDTIVEGGRQRAANIEQAKFQIEGLGKSWEKLYDDINYAVDGTAYGLDEAALAASQLSASGIEAGDSMKQALRGISGVAAMTNSSYSDVARVFTTVAGNGRLMGENLLSLSSRGINAAATLGEYLEKDEATIRDMVSKGQISFAMFAEAMDNAFGEHAKDANRTLTGIQSNVSAAFKKIGADFAAVTMSSDLYSASLKDILDNYGNVTKKASDFSKNDMNQINVLNEMRYVINGIRSALKDTGFVKDWEGFYKSISTGMASVWNSLYEDQFDENGKFTGVKLVSQLENSFKNLHDALYNLLSFVVGIADSVARAWRAVFPESLLDGLESFTGWLAKITGYLPKVGDVQNVIRDIFGLPLIGSERAVEEAEKVDQAADQIVESTEKVERSLADLARDVIRGDYGAGAERIEKLGDSYREVQDAVNKVYYEVQHNGKTWEEALAMLDDQMISVGVNAQKSAEQTTEAFEGVSDTTEAIAEQGEVVSEVKDIFGDFGDEASVVGRAMLVFKSALSIVRKVVVDVVTVLKKVVWPVVSSVLRIVGAIGYTVFSWFSELMGLIDRLLPAGEDFASKVDAILDVIRPVTDALKSIVDFVVEFIEALAPGGNPFAVIEKYAGSFLGFFRGFVSSLSHWGEVIAGFFGDLFSGRLFEGLGGIFEPVSEVVSKAFGFVVKVVTPLARYLGGLLSPLADRFREFRDSVVGFLAPVIEPLKALGRDIGKLFSGIFSGFDGMSFDGVFGIFSSMGKNLTNLFGGVGKLIGRAWGKIKPLLKPAFKAVKGFFAPIAEYFSSGFAKLSESISNGSSLKDALASAFDFGGIVKKVKNSTFFRVVRSLFEPLTTFLSDIWGRIKGWLDKIGSMFTLQFLSESMGGPSLGRKLLDFAAGIFKPVLNFFVKLPENIKSLWKSFKDAFSRFFNMGEYSDGGPNVFDKLLEIIGAFVEIVRPWIEAIGALLGAVGKVVKNAIFNLADLIASGGNPFSLIGDWFFDFSDMVREFLNSDAFLEVRAFIETMVGNLKSFIKETFRGIGTAIKEGLSDAMGSSEVVSGPLATLDGAMGNMIGIGASGKKAAEELNGAQDAMGTLQGILKMIVDNGPMIVLAVLVLAKAYEEYQKAKLFKSMQTLFTDTIPSLAKGFTSIVSPVASISGAINSVVKHFNDLQDSLGKAARYQAIAGMIKAIAVLIGVIAASLFVIALIPEPALIRAAIVVGAIVGSVVAITAILYKLSKNPKIAQAVFKVGYQFTALAIGLGILVGLIIFLSKQDLMALTPAMLFLFALVGGISAIVLVLTAVSARIGKLQSMNMQGIGATFVGISVAVVLMTVALNRIVKAFSENDPGQVWAAVGIMALMVVMLGGLMAFVQYMSKYGSAAGATTGAAILLMAVGVKIVAKALLDIASVITPRNENKIDKAMLALLEIFGGFAGLMLVAARAKSSIVTGGAGVLMMALGISMISMVLKSLSHIEQGQLERAQWALGEIMVLLGIMEGIAAFGNASILAGGGGVLMMAAGIALVAFAIHQLAVNLTDDQYGRAIESLQWIGGFLAALGVAAAVAGENMLLGGIGLLAMGGGILLVAAALAVLASLDPAGLYQGLAALVVVMGLLIAGVMAIGYISMVAAAPTLAFSIGIFAIGAAVGIAAWGIGQLITAITNLVRVLEGKEPIIEQSGTKAIGGIVDGAENATVGAEGAFSDIGGMIANSIGQGIQAGIANLGSVFLGLPEVAAKALAGVDDDMKNLGVGQVEAYWNGTSVSLRKVMPETAAQAAQEFTDTLEEGVTDGMDDLPPYLSDGGKTLAAAMSNGYLDQLIADKDKNYEAVGEALGIDDPALLAKIREYAETGAMTWDEAWSQSRENEVLSASLINSFANVSDTPAYKAALEGNYDAFYNAGLGSASAYAQGLADSNTEEAYANFVFKISEAIRSAREPIILAGTEAIDDFWYGMCSNENRNVEGATKFMIYAGGLLRSDQFDGQFQEAGKESSQVFIDYLDDVIVVPDDVMNFAHSVTSTIMQAIADDPELPVAATGVTQKFAQSVSDNASLFHAAGMAAGANFISALNHLTFPISALGFVFTICRQMATSSSWRDTGYSCGAAVIAGMKDVFDGPTGMKWVAFMATLVFSTSLLRNAYSGQNKANVNNAADAIIRGFYSRLTNGNNGVPVQGGKVASGFMTNFKEKTDKLIPAKNAIAGAVSSITTGMWTRLTNGNNGVPVQGTNSISDFMTNFKKKTDALVPSTKAGIAGAVSSITTGMWTRLNNGNNGVPVQGGNAISKFMTNFKEKTDALVPSTKAGIAGAVSSIATGMWNGLTNGKTGVTVQGTNSISDFMTNFKNQAARLGYEPYTIGQNTVIGLNNGIWNKYFDPINTINSLAGNVVTTLKNVLGIDSPSKVTFEMGAYLMEGLSLGITSGYSTVEGSVRSTTDAMRDALETSFALMDEIVSSDGAYRPVIRPVLDMSDARAALGSGEYTMGVMGMYSDMMAARISLGDALRRDMAYGSITNAQRNYSISEMNITSGATNASELVEDMADALDNYF